MAKKKELTPEKAHLKHNLLQKELRNKYGKGYEKKMTRGEKMKLTKYKNKMGWKK